MCGRRRIVRNSGSAVAVIMLVEQLGRRGRSDRRVVAVLAEASRRDHRRSPRQRRLSANSVAVDHGAAVVHAARRGGSTATPGCARSRRSRRPPSSCRSARSRCHRSQASRYCMPTLRFWRRPASVIDALGDRCSSIVGGDIVVPAHLLQVDLVRRPACLELLERDRRPGRGARPRCRRARRVASRFLSARTLAIAASLPSGVVLDRDLRRHAAHRVDAAPVAGLDQQLAVRAQEMAVHPDDCRGRAARSRGASAAA